ncbi:MAG: membrane protein insertase YidC [Anaerolineaceae bacterium]|nr:membrane protein insertase YidC [Anaerolineaceae bacterium]
MWDAIIISPFINILMFIYHYLGQNFGIAIILFTILIRLLTHPLMVKQIKGAQAMQDMQKDKRYVDLQTKYKGDKEKLQQEQAKLIQELGVNPFASCLPTLIQFPIIIGLYQAIIASMASGPVELLNLSKHIYPWLLDVSKLMPINNNFLWMELSQPERLIIPGLGFGIPVLTIIVVATSYLQSKLSMPPATDPNDASAKTSSMMTIMMPLMMGWISYTLSSGLALYFVISNVVGIGQYALLGKLNWDNLIPGRKPKAIIKKK